MYLYANRLIAVGVFYWQNKVKLPTLKPRLALTKPTTHSPKQSWGKGRGGRAWRKQKDRILVRDNYTCQCCGRVGGRLELDHIINLANGGADDDSNLQILCYTCHQQKTQNESRQGAGQKFVSLF